MSDEGAALARTVEALLFLSGDPLTSAELADAAEADERDVVAALAVLAERHAPGTSGIRLRVLCLGRVTRQVGLGLLQLRGVFLQRGLGLPKRFFVWPRIDLEQQITLIDVRPFDKVHGQQLAGDLRLHLDNRRRLHRPDGVNLDRRRLLGCDCHAHRNRRSSAGRGLWRSRLAATAQRNQTQNDN